MEHVDVGLERSFLQEAGKGVGGCFELVGIFYLYVAGRAHDDARWVEIVVERLALAQELGREEELEGVAILAVEALGVAHRNGGLDDHDGIGVYLQHEVDDFLHVRRVEVVLHGVVVGGGSNDHKVGVGIGCASVEGGGKV